MGRKPRELSSNAILIASIYTGLAALVRLARKRVDKRTRKYLESILTHWNKARSEYLKNQKSAGKSRRDFTPIKNAEANLRRFFLKILWHSTRRYGNKEFKRVYSWEEGKVGPLNALLNYLGARLRDLAMTLYPFPEPERFQVRVYPDGTKVTIQKKHVSKYSLDDAEDTYWKAGYKGNRKHPTVLLNHPTLPGLDFVDMIRAHGVELVRQCFIQNVPRSDAHRYIRLLIHRLTPFLDYVYTNGKSGRNHFEPDADRELRMLVLEIRSLYGGRVGKRQSITRELDKDIPEPTVEILQTKVSELIAKARDKKTREKLSQILDHIDQGRIVDRDIEKLFDQVLALAQKEGNDWHRVLLSDLHHPKSLKSVIFAGDTMLDHPSSVLIVGELPVRGAVGKGSIDLVVFIRRNIKGSVFWTPVMIIEIKSKTSFDFNLYAVETSKGKERPPALYAWKRGLTQEEWERTIESDPDDRVKTQLETYEKALLEECKGLVPADIKFPKQLWKGVIVLDTDQDYAEVFKAFHFLLSELPSGVLTGKLSRNESKTLVINPIDDSVHVPRVALLLLPSEDLSEFLREQSSAQSTTLEDPFRERVSDARVLTHYISIPSPTSFGNAAAWVSRNWHLLNHLEEISRKSDKEPQVYWLDLLGDYPTDQLLRRRFGLDNILKKKQITRERHESLSSLLERITFFNFRENIDSALLGKDIELLEVMKQLDFNEAAASERIVIVDGWTQLKEMVPLGRTDILRTIENQLLDTLPKDDVNVIWIDSGVPHTQMNKYYQRTCVRPLRHDSPRRFHIDEIIYNVPITPRIFGWRTPRREDTRIIIQDTPTKVSPWVQSIGIPHLKGWARRFRGLSRRDGVVTESEVFESDFEGEPMYGRSVTLESVQASLELLSPETVKQLQKLGLTLVPSLQRREISSVQEREYVDEHWRIASLSFTTSGSSLLTDRLTFTPDAPPPSPPRSKKRYSEFSKIKRGWFYDRKPIDLNDHEYEVGVSRRPPMYQRTGLDEVDSLLIRKREIKRVRSAARFLTKQLRRNSSLYSCCREIVRMCSDVSLESADENTPLTALEEIRSIILHDPWRAQIWSQVESFRKSLGDVLTTDNRAVLRMAQELCPDVLSLYGNNLFLALLTVMEIYSLPPSESLVTALWMSMAEWQLYQMGFQPQDHVEETARSQYDFQFIYSRLIFRAQLLETTHQPLELTEDTVYGQLIWTEREGSYEMWLVLPEEEHPLLGLASGFQGCGLMPGWQQCMTDPSKLRTSIKTMTKSPERNQVALTRIGETCILWFLDEIEGEDQWSAPLVLEYATSPEDGRLLRWFRLSPPPESILWELERSRPRLTPDVDARVDSLLFGAFKGLKEIEDVKVQVSVNLETERYRVEFSSGRSYEVRNTYELISLLRYPFLKGAPFRTDDGRLLYWDYKSDIEYLDTVDRRRGKAHVVSLSFLRPLVHRSDLFSLGALFPQTCSDLLRTRYGGTITLIAEVNEPRRNRGEFNFITVRLESLPKKSRLRHLEYEFMNPYELELLAECEGLVDAEIKRTFTLEIDVSQLRGIRLPSGLEEDSQLVCSLVHEDEEHEEQEISLPEGEWILSTDLKEGSIRWTLISPLMKTVWMGRTFGLNLNGTLNLEEMIEELEEALEMMGASRNNVYNYDEELNDVRERLGAYGWGDEKPQCRVEARQAGKGMKISLRTCGENKALVYKGEFNLNEDYDAEAVVDALNEGLLGEYTIENMDEFKMMLKAIFNEELELDDIDTKEAELILFIEGYRKDGKLEAACAHTNHLVEHYIKQKKFDTALEMVEENISRLVSMNLNEETKWYLFIARVLRAEILNKKNRLEDSKKEVERAFEVIPDNIALWKIGTGTKRDYYERSMKLRNGMK